MNDPRICPACGARFHAFGSSEEEYDRAAAAGELPIWEVAVCPTGHQFEVKGFFRHDGRTHWEIGEKLA
jgi:hypothetical protein